jgi:hypothetical protein
VLHRFWKRWHATCVLEEGEENQAPALQDKRLVSALATSGGGDRGGDNDDGDNGDDGGVFQPPISRGILALQVPPPPP